MDQMSFQEVLVVDDDPASRTIFKMVLELEGYLIHTAKNGQDALSMLESGITPRVILLDLMMPVLDGIGFLRIWHADPHLVRIPVVVISAFGCYPELQFYPVAAKLSKPTKFDDLVATVEQFCQ